MTTILFIWIILLLALFLIRQYGCYEDERSALAKEIKELLEILARQIAFSRRTPDLLSMEGELSTLASFGFFSTLQSTEDFALSLTGVLPRLPLPSCVTSRLSTYAEHFGQTDREGEERALRHLCTELFPLLDTEIEASKVRLRTFRIVTVALVLSVAILLC